jgi:hypothetical protein
MDFIFFFSSSVTSIPTAFVRPSPYTPVANDNVALGVKTCSSGMSSFEEQATAAPTTILNKK